MDVLERLQIKIGARMDITVENGRMYKTRLEDTARGAYLLVSTPLFRGVPVIFRKGQEVTLSFYREAGRFAVDARMVDVRVEGNVRLLVFDPYGEMKRSPLRNAFRLESRLDGIIRDSRAGPFPLRHTPEDEEDEEAVLVMDVSEAGLSFKSKTRFEVGDKLYIRVNFEWPEEGAPPMEFFSEVRRRELINPDEKLYQVGVQHLGLDEDSRKYVSRYVLVRQQQIIKQRRLVEGE